jgi:mannose-6-phosphate isomerase-like protein (cupin superfamily)
MESQRKKISAERKLKTLRREESLRSRQYRGVCVRVLYERDSWEILRTEMDPGSALDDREIGIFPAIHFVIEGSPVFQVANQTHDLMPGDSIGLEEREQYKISNPTSSRSSFLSFLFKNSATPKKEGNDGLTSFRGGKHEKLEG